MKYAKPQAPSSAKLDTSSRTPSGVTKKADAGQQKAARRLFQDLQAEVNKSGWKPYQKIA